MSASDEAELFRRLEMMGEWNVPVWETRAHYLQPLDGDCMQLAENFRNYAEHANLVNLTGDDLVKGVARVAGLLERDFSMMENLQIQDRMQTRGRGLCIELSDTGGCQDMYAVDDEMRIRGTFIGIECLPVPTEYALITGVFDDETAYEPLVCLLFEGVEAIEPTGEATPHEGVMALPLRVDGLRLDKVVY